MAITTASRFKSVSVETRDDYCSVQATLSDDELYAFDGLPHVVGNSTDTDLEAMRDIFETTAGFLDAMGNGVTVSISVMNRNWTGTLAAIENLGLYYPLSRPSFTNWLQRRQLVADQGRHVTRSTPTGGEVRHSSPLGDVPTTFTATTTTQDVSLDPWQGYIAGAGPPAEFVLTLPLAGTGVTTANIDNHIPVRAMKAYLESTKITTPTLPNAFLDFDNSAAPDRHFRWPKVVEGETWEWEITEVEEIMTGTTLTGVAVHCTGLAAADDPDVLDVVNVLNTETVAITRVTNGSVPQRGSDAVPHHAREIVLPNSRRIFERDGVLIWHDGSREQPLRGDFIVGQEVDELRAWSGTDMTNPPDRWAPAPTTQVIHLRNGRPNRRVRYPQLQSLMGPGMYAPQAFHNRNRSPNTGALALEDWNGNEFFILQPGQRAELELGHTADGGAELVGRHLPLRRVNSEQSGDLGNFGSVNYTTISSSHSIRPLPVATLDDDYRDADAFRIGTANILTASLFNDWTAYDIPQALVVLMDGFMTFKQHIEVEATSATGTITGEHFTTFFRIRGTANPVALTGAYQPIRRDIGGVGDTHLFTVDWSGPVRANDIYLPAYIYPDGATMDFSTLDLHNYSREVDLEPHIEIVASA